MKTPRLLLAVLASAALTLSALAADPTGTWKWSTPGRDGQSFESTLKLALQEGKLTGTLLGLQRDQFSIPDTAIEAASFKDGVVAFTITLEFNGNRFPIRYEGKLEGDSITGSVERPGRDGATQKRDWVAKRGK